jgi:hypothetical protein
MSKYTLRNHMRSECLSVTPTFDATRQGLRAVNVLKTILWGSIVLDIDGDGRKTNSLSGKP